MLVTVRSLKLAVTVLVTVRFLKLAVKQKLLPAMSLNHKLRLKNRLTLCSMPAGWGYVFAFLYNWNCIPANIVTSHYALVCKMIYLTVYIAIL